jgi:hypothetical protein
MGPYNIGAIKTIYTKRRIEMIKLLLILSIISCGKKHKEADVQPANPDVTAKAELYKSLNPGWSHGKCDSLGFTALCKWSGGCKDANIFEAEDNGMWYRTADHKCYDTGESASDFSKDMMVMLLPYLYSSGNIDAIKRIKNYGNNHGWRFGRGPISRSVMTPPIIAMIYKMADGSGDIPDREEEGRGFERNLDAVWMLTSAMVKGYMPDSSYKKIRGYAEDQPRNALFNAIKTRYEDGNQAQAIGILLDETLFPKDRLPSTLDRCEGYLWQRDDTVGDWGPCQPEASHDGIDFLIAASVASQL